MKIDQYALCLYNQAAAGFNQSLKLIVFLFGDHQQSHHVGKWAVQLFLQFQSPSVSRGCDRTFDLATGFRNLIFALWIAPFIFFLLRKFYSWLTL